MKSLSLSLHPSLRLFFSSPLPSPPIQNCTTDNAPTVSVLPVVGEQSLQVSWVVRDVTDPVESPKVTSFSVRYREESSQGQYETAVGIAPTDSSIKVSNGIQYQRTYSVQVAVLSQFDVQGTLVQGPWSEAVEGVPVQSLLRTGFLLSVPSWAICGERAFLPLRAIAVFS